MLDAVKRDSECEYLFATRTRDKERKLLITTLSRGNSSWRPRTAWLLHEAPGWLHQIAGIYQDRCNYRSLFLLCLFRCDVQPRQKKSRIKTKLEDSRGEETISRLTKAQFLPSSFTLARTLDKQFNIVRNVRSTVASNAEVTLTY